MSRAEPLVQDAAAFALTVAIEWPLLAWLSALGWRRTGLFCLLMNGVSWGALMAARDIWNIPIVPLEIAVIAVETLLMAYWWKWRPARAFGIACILNLASWGLGSIILPLILK